MPSTVLYCTVLYCTVLYCTVLYCTVLYCTVLYCTVLYYTIIATIQIKSIFYSPLASFLFFTFSTSNSLSTCSYPLLSCLSIDYSLICLFFHHLSIYFLSPFFSTTHFFASPFLLFSWLFLYNFSPTKILFLLIYSFFYHILFSQHNSKEWILLEWNPCL